MLDSRRRFKIKTEKIQEWRVELDSLSYSDMCNPQPAALFGAARLFSFMILKWYFKWIVFLNFLYHSFHNLYEQRNVTIFKYLGTIDHETNTTFRVISNCHATTQIQLFVM